MEGRRIIHNNRSQIEEVLGDSIKANKGRGMDTKFSVKYEKKTFETMSCKWCGLKFDKKQIYCNRCRSCQYCGMLIFSTNSCHVCGNKSQETSQVNIKRFRIHK